MTSIALLRPTADECVFAECVSMIHMTPVMLVCLYWMRSLGGLDLALVQLYCLQVDLPLWSCVYHVVYCTTYSRHVQVRAHVYRHMCKHTPPYTTHQITLALTICHELELHGLPVDSSVTAPPSCCWLQGRAYSTCYSCGVCLPHGLHGELPLCVSFEVAQILYHMLLSK